MTQLILVEMQINRGGYQVQLMTQRISYPALLSPISP